MHMLNLILKQYLLQQNKQNNQSNLNLLTIVKILIKHSVKALQKCVGVKQDGGLGPITLDAVEEHDPENLIEMIADEREKFYKRLKTFKHFGKGWLKRNEETMNHALANVEIYTGD